MKPGVLKEVIKREYQKCAKDPVYFLKKVLCRSAPNER